MTEFENVQIQQQQQRKPQIQLQSMAQAQLTLKQRGFLEEPLQRIEKINNNNGINRNTNAIKPNSNNIVNRVIVNRPSFLKHNTEEDEVMNLPNIPVTRTNSNTKLQTPNSLLGRNDNYIPTTTTNRALNDLNLLTGDNNIRGNSSYGSRGRSRERINDNQNKIVFEIPEYIKRD